jgi:hypothetical protein
MFLNNAPSSAIIPRAVSKFSNNCEYRMLVPSNLNIPLNTEGVNSYMFGGGGETLLNFNNKSRDRIKENSSMQNSNIIHNVNNLMGNN